MFKVIVINGAGGSGKDTFVDQFDEVCQTYNLGVRRMSSVDKVKRFAREMGWGGEKDEKGRRFLSDLKDALAQYNDQPYRDMVVAANRLREHIESGLVEEGFLFLFSREPEEIGRLVEELNATTLLIERPEVVPYKFFNHADAGVEGYAYDYTITNDGTLEDLEQKARAYLKWLVKGILDEEAQE